MCVCGGVPGLLCIRPKTHSLVNERIDSLHLAENPRPKHWHENTASERKQDSKVNKEKKQAKQRARGNKFTAPHAICTTNITLPPTAVTDENYTCVYSQFYVCQRLRLPAHTLLHPQSQMCRQWRKKEKLRPASNKRASYQQGVYLSAASPKKDYTAVTNNWSPLSPRMPSFLPSFLDFFPYHHETLLPTKHFNNPYTHTQKKDPNKKRTQNTHCFTHTPYTHERKKKKKSHRGHTTSFPKNCPCRRPRSP